MEQAAASNVTPLREGEPPYRQPPSNIEAEQALLAAILVNNTAYHRVSEFLRAEHFALGVHGRIYAAITKLMERGQLANPVTLKNLFEQDDALQEVGGAQYLSRLAASVVTIINAEDYGRTIHDLYLRRQLITIGEDVVNEAYQHDLDRLAVKQIEQAEKKLFDLAETGQAEGGFRPFASPLANAILAAEAAFKRSGKTSGVSTGFLDLDKLLGGLHPSDLVILAGRPSMGKTALATNIGFNAARAYRPGKDPTGKTIAEDGAVVGFFSLEMSAEQLATRILSEESGVSSNNIRKGEVSHEDFDRFVQASQRLASIPFFVDDTPALSDRRAPDPRAAPAAPARPRLHHRRLSPAHSRRRIRHREPRPGNLRDHPRPQGAGERAQCAGDRAVAALARRRAARRQAADALGSA